MLLSRGNLRPGALAPANRRRKKSGVAIATPLQVLGDLEVGAPLVSVLGDGLRLNQLTEQSRNVLIAVAVKRRHGLEQVADSIPTGSVLSEEAKDFALENLILLLLRRQLLRSSVLLVKLLNHLVQLGDSLRVRIADGSDSDGESSPIRHLGSSHGINPFSVCGVQLSLITCLL